MAENLNYQTFSGSWCYNPQEGNCDTYGRLYNWETSNSVCPDGWHLPSDAEWKELEIFLGMSKTEADAIFERGLDEGGKMKETGTVHWKSPNTGSNNFSGFNALPGGYRASHGYFNDLGNYAYFWSASEDVSDNAWYRLLNYSNAVIYRNVNNKAFAFSVRCFKDE
jgi:uncharacterized protein (TIGR02145 family)